MDYPNTQPPLDLPYATLPVHRKRTATTVIGILALVLGGLGLLAALANPALVMTAGEKIAADTGRTAGAPARGTRSRC